METRNDMPDGNGPQTMHDIILDYITTQAYASTALALSRPKAASSSSTPAIPGAGPSRSGEQLSSLAGAAAAARHAQRSSNSNGNGSSSNGARQQSAERMDVDLDMVAGIPTGGGDDVDMDGAGGTPSRAQGRAKGKGKSSGDGGGSVGGTGPRMIDDETLQSIETRRAIFDLILNGAITRAVDMLNAHFPSVLADQAGNRDEQRYPGSVPIPITAGHNGSSSATIGFASSLPNAQKWPSMTPTGHSASYGLSHRPSLSSMTLPAGASGASRIPQSESRNTTSQPATSLPHSMPIYTQSTYPSHVRLNLQIQAFIESIRQITPSSPSTPSSSIGSLASSMHASFHGAAAPPPAMTGPSLAVPKGSNGNGGAGSGGWGGSSVALTRTLGAAQALHEEAKKLRPEEGRAAYLQEVKDAAALLAYADPETSILRGFLEQDRRIAISEQVNRAILCSEGRGPQSQLEEISRRVVATWTMMENEGVDYIPPWTAADGQGKEQLAAVRTFHFTRDVSCPAVEPEADSRQFLRRALTKRGLTLQDFVAHVWA